MHKIQLNAMLIISLIINLLGVGSFYMTFGQDTFFMVMLTFWLIGVIGLAVALFTNNKFGLYAVIFSNIVFLPIGIIGMLGARNALDSLKLSELDT